MDPKKTVAVVTGASRGIGRATSLRLASDFSALVLVARDKDKLEATAADVRSAGAETMIFDVDLSQSQSGETVIKGTLDHYGRIDALLNIAGAVPQIDLFEMTDAQWDDGMALKLHGARRLTMKAWDALKASTGSVVFMSEAQPSVRNQHSRRSRQSTQPSTHSQRHSPNKESKTECRSTAYRPER